MKLCDCALHFVKCLGNVDSVFCVILGVLPWVLLTPDPCIAENIPQLYG